MKDNNLVSQNIEAILSKLIMHHQTIDNFLQLQLDKVIVGTLFHLFLMQLQIAVFFSSSSSYFYIICKPNSADPAFNTDEVLLLLQKAPRNSILELPSYCRKIRTAAYFSKYGAPLFFHSWKQKFDHIQCCLVVLISSNLLQILCKMLD